MCYSHKVITLTGSLLFSSCENIFQIKCLLLSSYFESYRLLEEFRDIKLERHLPITLQITSFFSILLETNRHEFIYYIMTRGENTLTFLMYFSTSSTFLRDIYRHPEARYLKCSEDGTLLLSTLKCIKRKLENVSPTFKYKRILR